MTMSLDSPVRPRTASTSRSTSAFAGSPRFPTEQLHPCTATAAYFLFSQGTSIVVLHHDTLALERRFEGHRATIVFITADNVSERGAGRLVVSYDVSHTAIVWDLFTGNEISRFASFELIRVGSWICNGNVAFGNAKGEVIIFEPATSEHISAQTIFDSITALAPAADCQRHAIGYANGSILIVTVQPNFTILHTLSTSQGPAPIVSLAWHASSARQKSDMLATQTVVGDLFLWSVSKQSSDSPRVIRALKKPESGYTSRKWLAWSKNGRLIQFADGETWSWDVRTKHVTYDCVPTATGLVGIANYGPTSTLFTIGPDHTIQQYDLSSGLITANVQHLPGTSVVPPSLPPAAAQSPPHASHTLQKLDQRFIARAASPSSTPTDHSPRIDRVLSPASTRSRTGSASSRGSFPRPLYRHKSQIAKTLYSGTGTSFSTGSHVHTLGDTSLYSGSSMRYGPVAPGMGPRSRPGSRLRQEVLPSLEEEEDFVNDLFPYIRSRLNELPFSTPRRLDETNSSSDELRKRMLQVVFGWEGDIEGLIRDELGHHAVGSARAILLSRWLAHLDRGLMLAMAGSANSSYLDWMLLALSQLGSHSESKKIGLAFVQQLLASGDIHASVAVLLGMGDSNDAVEVYVSRNHYMEAILLASLLMPSEWTRLSYLVRKWGEYVVQNSQQHLAIRCFACTDAEPPEPWDTQSVKMTNILSDQLKSQPKLSPPMLMSPHNQPLTLPSQPTAKRQSLKLITQFSKEPEPQFKFPGLASANMTPTNLPGVTPIDSAQIDPAMSPGYRAHTPRSIAQSLSKASTPASYATHRLPSIGETPTDVLSSSSLGPKALPTPGDSGSDHGRKSKREHSNSYPRLEDSPELLTATIYAPAGTQATPWVGRDTSSLTGRMRSLSRDRKVMDLRIDNLGAEQPQLPASVFGDPFSFGQRGKVSSPPPLPSTNAQDLVRNSAVSPSREPGTTASMGDNHVDDYVSSVNEEEYYLQPLKSAQHDEKRGRTEHRYIQPAKRSPTSIPVPARDSPAHTKSSSSLVESPGKVRQTKSRSRSKPRSVSRKRRASKPRTEHGRSKPSSRATSTDRSKLVYVDVNGRRTPSGYCLQSTTSSAPFVPSDTEQSTDFEQKLRFVTEDRKHRMHSMERKTGKRSERSRSGARDGSNVKTRQSSGQATPTSAIPVSPPPVGALQGVTTPSHRHSRSMGAQPLGINSCLNNSTGNLNLSRKELAAAELEARRLSLARRPSAPAIPHPGEIQSYSARTKNHGEDMASTPLSGGSLNQKFSTKKLTPGSAQSQFESVRIPCTVPVGLPSTPRAMKHPKYSAGYVEVPAVPGIPGNIAGDESANVSCDNLVATLPRAMSAPVPYDQIGGLPARPQFNRTLPGSKISNGPASSRRGSANLPSPPLQHHQRQNPQQPLSPPTSGTIGKSGSNQVSPPLLPQLQHLGGHAPPPPPPPPPAAPDNLRSDQRLSLNSAAGSGVSVGTINIAMDNGTAGEGYGVSNDLGLYGVVNVPQRPATTNSVRPEATYNPNFSHGSSYYNPTYAPIERSTSAQGTTHEFTYPHIHPSHGRSHSISEHISVQSRIKHMAERISGRSGSINGRVSISRPMSPPEQGFGQESVDHGNG